MTLDRFLEIVRECPLIVSAQSSPGAANAVPETLRQLAQCSLDQGVRILRLEGVESIVAIKGGTPGIGLIKKQYGDSEIYITPTKQEVQELLGLGCEVIAMDATPRGRPNGEQLKNLVLQVHEGGALAMADCDSPESIDFAIANGCDLIGTTLAGYTGARAMSIGPDFELIRYAVSKGKPVIAEGRFSARWQIEAALHIGATAVVVGGAINDPVKQTKAMLPIFHRDLIGAIDIGGTWMRFAVFLDNQIQHIEKIETPLDREQRMEWIRNQVNQHRVARVGVGTGGTVDPATGEVWEAKPIINDHQGSVYNQETLGVPTVAISDGLATAWGHACHPDFAGKNVATLALGTGVGAGYVREGKIIHGPRGEYPRFNDLPTKLGATVEELLGGLALTTTPSKDQQLNAIVAFETCVDILQKTMYPDAIVVAGTVGLSDWLRPIVLERGCHISPYAPEAGLYGSMWLASYRA